MKNKKKKILISFLIILTIITGILIKKNNNIDFELNKYTCVNCNMLISSVKFRYQFINKNNKSFKFDDINCMFNWANKNNLLEINNMWGTDYFENKWIKLNNSFIIKEKNIKTPMNSNILIFEKEKNLNEFKEKKILNVKDFIIKKND